MTRPEPTFVKLRSHKRRGELWDCRGEGTLGWRRARLRWGPRGDTASPGPARSLLPLVASSGTRRSNWPFSPQVPKGKVVVLNFRFLDLESDNLCRYDFVDVYSGHASGQRIGRFCGTFRPGALVSSGNRMMVQMISDANTAGNGFMAAFSAADPEERGTGPGTAVPAVGRAPACPAPCRVLYGCRRL